MDNYGFIITRHVNSEKTNKYWNQSVQCIRRFYPTKKIVIIDDNSNQNYVKADFDYKNVEIIQSEYPGRGELLPYYYYFKHRFFKNAVIIHDSVFFHKRINFEKMSNIKVMPFWYFNKDKENTQRILNLLDYLSNSFHIKQKITLNDNVMGLNHDKWYGCFGVQSYINLDFLTLINNKYKLFNLLKVIRCRQDRCCLERIFGAIFSTEYKVLLKHKSILGDIFNYQKWGYTYDDYTNDLKQRILPAPIIKIWTGR
jgi:hypothetical protein